MGAYNTVTIPWLSSRNGEIVIQFKYGSTWQHEYRIGDELLWGGNNIGVQNVKHVVVDGTPEKDEENVPDDFEVHIFDNRIDRVLPATGQYDFASAGELFIIIDP